MAGVKVEAKTVERIERGWPLKVDKAIYNHEQRIKGVKSSMDETAEAVRGFVEKVLQGIEDLRGQVGVLQQESQQNSSRLEERISSLELRIKELETSSERNEQAWTLHHEQHEERKGLFAGIFGGHK